MPKDELVPVKVQVDRTRQALEDTTHNALADALRARQFGGAASRKPSAVSGVLMIDTSGSMGEPLSYDRDTNQSVRKIDRLREVVDQVRAQCPAEMVGFGAETGIVSEISEPGGSTPLTEALEIAATNQFTHLVVISDGCPNSTQTALEVAQRYNFKIDTCYIGTAGDYGEEFMKELAQQCGGTHQRGDLSEPLQLASALKGLLGAGAREAIQL
jgi:Mg-chelatase subunit ChlD